MEWIKSKVLDLSKLEVFCQSLKNKNIKISMTTGFFDVLHIGHLYYLAKAKELGNVLVVGIDCDFLVKKTKGPERPINPENDRALLVAGLDPVNLVSIFQNKLEIIEAVKPNFFVMSTSSNIGPEQRTTEKDLVEKYGGQVVILEPQAEIHSTDIIKKMAKT